ncbi:hypothetical protein AKO1_000288, partial [Acrasis kona]
MNGHYEMTKLLIKNGISPNHPDSSDNYPIHYAAAYGFIDIFKLLMECGAKIDQFNAWKKTPFDIACGKNHTGISNFILSRSDFDVNLKDEHGYTIIYRLLQSKDLSVIQQILNTISNVDLNAKDPMDNTILHYVAESPNELDLQTIQEFIKH